MPRTVAHATTEGACHRGTERPGGRKEHIFSFEDSPLHAAGFEPAMSHQRESRL